METKPMKPRKPETNHSRNTTPGYKLGRILGILLITLTVLLITTGTIALLKLLITYILT